LREGLVRAGEFHRRTPPFVERDCEENHGKNGRASGINEPFALRVSDAFVIVQFFFALYIFSRSLIGKAVVFFLDRAADIVADSVDRYIPGVAK
jgi:hypothetical protein